jgi:hypothetical protein
VRASGSACVIPGNRMLVFGGYDGSEFLQDLWVLHTGALRCAALRCPPPCAFLPRPTPPRPVRRTQTRLRATPGAFSCTCARRVCARARN